MENVPWRHSSEGMSCRASTVKLLLGLLIALLREAVCWEADGWQYAHATFYGGTDASGTMAGACGYGDLYSQGYGTHTAALSAAIFQNGLNCGACYEIYCDAQTDGKWCLAGSPHVTITATNFCPANYALPSDNGGWCNSPRVHFDMAYPAFQQIAVPRSGIVPVKYRSVSCNKSGGIRFTVNGNPYFNLVLVTNVGGSGEVYSVSMRGTNTDWIPMTQNWGQNWQCHQNLVGQAISFLVRNGKGEVVTSFNVAEPGWRFGQTFEGSNFR